MRFIKTIITITIISFELGLISNNTCFAQNVIKILPLGNSITVGYTNGSLPESQLISYRYGLFTRLNNAGFTFNFVGSESGGWGLFNDYQHGGINGIQDQHLVQLLTTGYDEKRGRQITAGPYLDVYNPDIILLHLGTNDVTYETNPGTVQMEAILNLIDAYEARAGKTVTVFLALIINRKIGQPLRTATSNYNNQLKAMALARIANGDRIEIVDMEHDAGFLYNITDMTDNVHPNATGYDKMAALWFQNVSTKFNHAPIISPKISDQILAEGESFTKILLNNHVSDEETTDEMLQWTILPSYPEHIEITINENNEATIVPKDINWNGSDTIIFKVRDLGVNGGFIQSASDTVIFSYTPVNDAPVFSSLPYLKAKEDSMYFYVVEATDAENQSLTYSASLLPSWLNFSPENKTLTGTPQQENVGQNAVTLCVTDGIITTNQSFIINVADYNTVPKIIGMARQVKTVKNRSVELRLTDLLVTDEDNNYPSDFMLEIGEGENYSVNLNNISPGNEFVGTLRVRVRVNDGTDYSSYSFINVLVDPYSDVKGDLENKKVVLYPNPADDQICIYNNSDEKDYSIILYSNSGAVIFQSSYSDNTCIDIKSLNISPGLYLYRINLPTETIVGKIIIN